MSIIRALTASAELVPAGTKGFLHSISFPSDDEDIYVKIREDGVSDGDVRYRAHMDATTALGDDNFSWKAGDPRGCEFPNGMYFDFSNDDGSTAGTGTINVEYTPG